MANNVPRWSEITSDQRWQEADNKKRAEVREKWLKDLYKANPNISDEDRRAIESRTYQEWEGPQQQVEPIQQVSTAPQVPEQIDTSIDQMVGMPPGTQIFPTQQPTQEPTQQPTPEPEVGGKKLDLRLFPEGTDTGAVGEAVGTGFRRAPFAAGEMAGKAGQVLGRMMQAVGEARPEGAEQDPVAAALMPFAEGISDMGKEVIRIATTLEEAAGDELKGRLKMSDRIQNDFIARGVANGFEMLGPAALAVVPSVLTGNPLPAMAITGGLFGLSAFKDTENELLDAGVPSEEAFSRALLHGVAEGGIESISTVLEHVTAGLAKPATKVLRQIAKKSTKSLLRRMATIYGTEYAEEVAQGATEKFLKDKYKDNPNVQNISWENIFKETLIPVAISTLALSGAGQLTMAARNRAEKAQEEVDNLDIQIKKKDLLGRPKERPLTKLSEAEKKLRAEEEVIREDPNFRIVRKALPPGKEALPGAPERKALPPGPATPLPERTKTKPSIPLPGDQAQEKGFRIVRKGLPAGKEKKTLPTGEKQALPPAEGLQALGPAPAIPLPTQAGGIPLTGEVKKTRKAVNASARNLLTEAGAKNIKIKGNTVTFNYKRKPYSMKIQDVGWRNVKKVVGEPLVERTNPNLDAAMKKSLEEANELTKKMLLEEKKEQEKGKLPKQEEIPKSQFGTPEEFAKREPLMKQKKSLGKAFDAMQNKDMKNVTDMSASELAEQFKTHPHIKQGDTDALKTLFLKDEIAIIAATEGHAGFKRRIGDGKTKSQKAWAKAYKIAQDTVLAPEQPAATISPVDEKALRTAMEKHELGGVMRAKLVAANKAGTIGDFLEKNKQKLGKAYEGLKQDLSKQPAQKKKKPLPTKAKKTLSDELREAYGGGSKEIPTYKDSIPNGMLLDDGSYVGGPSSQGHIDILDAISTGRKEDVTVQEAIQQGLVRTGKVRDLLFFEIPQGKVNQKQLDTITKAMKDHEGGEFAVDIVDADGKKVKSIYDDTLLPSHIGEVIRASKPAQVTPPKKKATTSEDYAKLANAASTQLGFNIKWEGNEGKIAKYAFQGEGLPIDVEIPLSDIKNKGITSIVNTFRQEIGKLSRKQKTIRRTNTTNLGKQAKRSLSKMMGDTERRNKNCP